MITTSGRVRVGSATSVAVASLLAVTTGGCSEQAGSRDLLPASLGAATETVSVSTQTPGIAIAPAFAWQVVVNNAVVVPGDGRRFNSYNQPSVNVNRLVVFRARSRGGAGGEPAHGVFTRDMAQAGTPIITIFDRNTLVPHPNNLGTQFVEPPSFPRIDMWSDTIASRANHPPVWQYLLPDGSETRAGTTGIYTNPFAALIAGASNLGAVPAFPFFAVPGTAGIKFDVFPGAPAVTDGATIVFKGNHTAGLAGKTGVYYRDLTNAAAGGTQSSVVIADTDTMIPVSGSSAPSSTPFGSTAPPSAVGRQAVFAGFDDEESPTLGGIYLAPLTGPRPALTALVEIGEKVPGEATSVFNRLGEGVSFDGRFVAFWGAWGSETTSRLLQCPTEGNKIRVAYCKELYPNGFTATVPVHQGMFVHDVQTGVTHAVAKAPADFDDFLYWNFSGLVPGAGESDDAGEPARWRSAAFAAVSGLVDGRLNDASFHGAFKARRGAVDGIYLRQGPGNQPLAIVVETGMDGRLIDPEAVFVDEETGAAVVLPVTEMGIERDGLRGNALAVTVSMGAEEAGWAGIYLTTVPR